MKLYELIRLITSEEEELFDVPDLHSLHLFLLGDHDDFWKEILNLSLYDWHHTYRSDILPGQWRNFAVYVNSQIPPSCQREITCHSECLGHKQSNLYRIEFPDKLYVELSRQKGYFRHRTYFSLPLVNEFWPVYADPPEILFPEEYSVSAKFRIMPWHYFPDARETFVSIFGPYPEHESCGVYIDLKFCRIADGLEEVPDDKLELLLDKNVTLISNERERVIRNAFDDISFRIKHFEPFNRLKEAFNQTAREHMIDENFIKDPFARPYFGTLNENLHITIREDEKYRILISLQVFRFE